MVEPAVAEDGVEAPRVVAEKDKGQAEAAGELLLASHRVQAHSNNFSTVRLELKTEDGEEEEKLALGRSKRERERERERELTR